MSKKILVLIDCGHCLNGADTGAAGLGYREEVLTREIGNALGNIFDKVGVEYFYVHPNSASSVNESLRARVNKANKYGYAVLFLSIHLNSFSGGQAHGVEVLISGRGGNAEKFANQIQSRFVKDVGLYNRGVKVNNKLYVLNNTNMPAALVECGFINNTGDMAKYNPYKYAEAIAEGVLNMDIEGSTSTPSTPAPTPSQTAERYFTTYNVDSSLTIREKGTTEAKAIGSIPAGAKFKFNWVDSDYLGWLYITYNGISGYVCAKYTKEIKELEPQKEKWGIVINVNANSSLTVRNGAGTNYNNIGKVFKDEEVRIVWTEPGWHYIEYSTSNGKKRGYVKADYIKTFYK